MTSIESCVRARLFDQFAKVLAVERLVDNLEKAGLHFGIVAVADGVEQQVAERPVLKGELAEDVEDLPAEGTSFFVELLQQTQVDFAFARILGHEIPEVADLGLADAVDATEALLQAVRIPGQVVVDHQVGALQVDSLAGGVGGEEDFDFLVMRECLLGLAPFLAADAAVNDDDRLGPSEECPDALGQIVQRVAMLGEDDELAPMPVGVEHLRVVLQEPGQLIPLAIGSGLPDTQSDALQAL